MFLLFFRIQLIVMACKGEQEKYKRFLLYQLAMTHSNSIAFYVLIVVVVLSSIFHLVMWSSIISASALHFIR